MTQPRQALLNALDGVCYLADAEGRVLEVGEPSFGESLRRFGADPVHIGSYIGRNLFDLMQGAEVRAAYRAIHDAVLAGARPYVGFELRCDGPDVSRLLRMSISAVRESSGGPALLYQSQILSVVTRPWMSLFDPKRIVDRIGLDAGLPIVRVCSFCQRVARPRQGAEEWVAADKYYRLGGPSDVRVSHGVCPDCAQKIIPRGSDNRL